MNNSVIQPFLFFMHIPKTAGSSVTKILQDQYQDHLNVCHVPFSVDFNQWNELFKDDEQKFRCITGHFCYGIHQFTDRPYVYAAFMREPINAALSYYYFIMRSYHHFQIILDVDTFFSSANTYFIEFLIRNYQSGYLVGHRNPSFHEAKIIINNHFPLIGITEMLHESVYLFRKRFGWTNVHVPYLNVTPNRPSIESHSPKTIERIRSLVDCDTQAYLYAKNRLSEALMELTSAEKKELDMFKKTDILQ